MMLSPNFVRKFVIATTFVAVGLISTVAQADWFIRFDESDFAVTDVFNDLRTFSFEIQIAGSMTAGVYNNPAIVGVDYTVFGVLPDATPSGFGAFLLNRPGTAGAFSGTEFYAQGSSLRFEIDAAADFSDGLQFDELVGGANAFVFDGREVGTGRYHPPIIELNGDGTGLMENSNNMGGVNPATGNVVNVNRGDEYTSTFVFNPSNFTIGTVPEPSSLVFLGIGLGLIGLRRRK